MATRIDITLEQLHHLQARVDRRQLAAQDWPVVAGLVSMLIARDRLEQIDSVARAQAPAPSSAGPPAKQAVQHLLRPGIRPAYRYNSPPGAGAPQPMVGLGPGG